MEGGVGGAASGRRTGRHALGALRARWAAGALTSAALLALVAGCGGGTGGRNAEAEGRALRFAEAIGGRDTAVLHRLVTEDYVLHASSLPGGEVRGRDAFLEGVASRPGAWPPGRITVTQLLSSGDRVASFGIFQPGANPLAPDDTAGAGPGVRVAAFHRVKEGRIAETWAVWDTRALEGLAAGRQASVDTARGGPPD
jgi:predicted ester cyclase